MEPTISGTAPKNRFVSRLPALQGTWLEALIGGADLVIAIIWTVAD